MLGRSGMLRSPTRVLLSEKISQDRPLSYLCPHGTQSNILASMEIIENLKWVAENCENRLIEMIFIVECHSIATLLGKQTRGLFLW